MATLLDALETSAREGCGFIMLPHGKFVLVDEDDLELLTPWRWSCSKSGYEYVRARINGHQVSIHRFVTAAPDEMIVDHKNRNKLDNRRTNLRQCSYRQNAGNSIARKKKNPTSQYKGVSRTGAGQKAGRIWAARGSRDGKATYIGSFETEIEAARAYDKFAVGYFGEFALLNGV